MSVENFNRFNDEFTKYIFANMTNVNLSFDICD